MPRLLNVLGFGLLAVGIALLVAGAVQAFGGVRIFADPPWTVGGGLATIAGMLVGASRPRR